MRRSWNWIVWVGFGVALLATFSYIPFFSRFPSMRDVPWVNLLLFLGAGCLLAIGLYRAFAQSRSYGGKIGGAALAALRPWLFRLFWFGVFYKARYISVAQTSLRVWQPAPCFM